MEEGGEGGGGNDDFVITILGLERVWSCDDFIILIILTTKTLVSKCGVLVID